MISKYGSFILEKRIINLILEKDLMASQEFQDKLSLIKDKSNIAMILYISFNNEFYINSQLAQNWIDVTDKEDTISFISDDRADKWFETDDNEDVDQIYKTKGRGDIKIGRFARAFIGNKDIMSNFGLRHLSTNLKDKDYEDFVNLYKSIGKVEGAKFELATGKQIRKYYHEDSYAFTTGQLGNSCMRYECCQGYLDIYVKNPKVCSLLVYLDGDNMVIGRALIWRLSKSPSEAEYLMDRIYTAKDSDIIKFQSYAESQGWMTKWKNTSDSSEALIFKYKGNPVVGVVEVKLSTADFMDYPFMDTISFIDKKNKLASNVSDKGREEANMTEGGALDGCNYCGGDGEFSGVCPDCEDGKRYCLQCGGVGKDNCKTCSGIGIVNSDKCVECGGLGRVKKTVRTIRCKVCDGKGITGDPCKECGGTGISKCTSCEDGKVDCGFCDGEGVFSKDPCPGCVGFYRNLLKEISKNQRFTSVKELVKIELEKLKPIKADKKKKKKK